MGQIENPNNKGASLKMNDNNKLNKRNDTGTSNNRAI